MKLADLQYKSGTYLAFVLSEKTRSELIKKYPPSFSRVLCHHVTIIFNLTEEKLKQFQYDQERDDDLEPIVRAVGICLGQGIEAFKVDVEGEDRRYDGNFYHLTHSVEPPRKPVESNDLLKTRPPTTSFNKKWIVLEGEFELCK